MPAASWPSAASTALLLAEILIVLCVLCVAFLLGAVVFWVRLGLWQKAVKAGRRAAAAGRYEEAEAHLRRARRVAGWFRATSPQRVATLDALGQLYLQQGKLDEAEPVLRQSVAQLRAARKPSHRDLAAGLNNLALLCKARGQHTEAEQLCQEALEIWEWAGGPGDPQVAPALNNLGAVYEVQARYPGVAGTLNNLGTLKRVRGDYQDAEQTLRQSLAATERALGPDHPGVAKALNNLGTALQAQGRYDEAERLYQR